VLRRVFGSKRDEVTADVRYLHNEKLNYLYSSPNIVRVIKSRMGWVGDAARMRKGKACTSFWCGNLRKKRPLGRPRLRWEDNVKMDLQEVGCAGTDWIELAQDRES
jgi:hypothetical protein